MAEEIANQVTFMGDSAEAERSWVLLHTEQGPYALTAWYRPPAPGNTSCIDSFETEWRQHASDALGSIIVGDLNVHHREWLRHSSRNSKEGTTLRATCYSLGLRQMVREPTREQHLLDLVLTDIESVKCKVLPKIADHNVVETSLKLSVPQQAPVKREVWDYRKADWEQLVDSLGEANWIDIMAGATVHEAAQAMTDKIMEASELSIPKRSITEKKSTHPWLTDRVVEFAEAKAAAVGTEDEKDAAERCSHAIIEEKNRYVQRVRAEMAELPRGSKQWWAKSRELLQMKGRSSSIPAQR